MTVRRIMADPKHVFQGDHMPRNPFTTTFDPRNPAHRTVREWRNPGIQTWKTCAKAYAAFHGESKVLRADGSVVCYRRTPEGTVRQLTYTQVVMVQG